MKYIQLTLLVSYWLHCQSAASCSGGSIAIFGGTGQLGSECAYQALKNGHKVSILARDFDKMTVPKGSGGDLAGKRLVDKNLKLFKGAVTEQSSVDKVFEGNDITGVIIALGGRTKKVGPSMLTDGTTTIINSMRKYSVKRVAVVTSIGCGDSEKKAPWSFRALMYTVMRKAMRDKNNQENLFLSPTGIGRDLEYCIVRPGGLGTGPPTGIIHANYDNSDPSKGGEGGSIQRSDLGSFMVQAVTDEAFPHVRKTPGMSSFAGTSWKKDPSMAGFDAPTAIGDEEE